MMQNRWKDAEITLEKSIAIFEEQIDGAVHSDSEFFKNEHRKNLMTSEAAARNMLVVAYFRQGRQTEAMEVLEKAYQEALQSSAKPEMIQQIVESGRKPTAVIGDSAARKSGTKEQLLQEGVSPSCSRNRRRSNLRRRRTPSKTLLMRRCLNRLWS
jgi:hypothetical protein